MVACATTTSSQVLSYLLSQTSISVNAKNRSGRTALHIALTHGTVEMIKTLLQSLDIDVNICDLQEGGCTPLMMACSESILHEDNQKQILRLLLLKDANIEAQDEVRIFHHNL